jgi:hypothetical protein
MPLIEVDPLGLLALAGHCEAQATRLASIATPALTAGGFQPSAAAVEAAHADVAAVGARLTARMQATATTAWAAAGEYLSTDTSSAAHVASLGAEASGITAV